TKVEGYGLLNLRLGLKEIPMGDSSRADFSFWVRNAANADRPVNFIDIAPGFFANLMTAYYPEPRTYGATFSYRW
ncbi:MAG: TonB-dependent receptor, partial [Burkholderiaceae bacterium]|nr:TonB-dependent receptor [Burkholderiaceae bacterium]